MSFFLIPPLHNNNISIDQINLTSDEIDNHKLSLTLNSYLNNIKKQIDDNYETWDFVKKYTKKKKFLFNI